MIIIDLSRNLIKRYVIASTPEKITSTSETVNGTVVSEGDVLYVQIDGSSILTPVSSTIDLKDGDRVLVLLKNHEAMVIGSPTSPTARLEELRELEQGVTEFEVILADKVGTGELVAMQALIEELEAKDVEISGELTANKADIEALEAENATINGTLTAYKTDIEELQAETAKIEGLEAEVAKIETLEADNVTINNTLTAHTADISRLDADYATINGKLTAVEADIDNLDATYATIDQLEVEQGRIDILETNSLTADSAEIKNLQADVADIDTLIFGSASGTTIQTSFANAVIAQLGNAQIKSAMIESLAADKIAAGDIITNNVRVLSEDGKLLISDETIQISDDTRVRVQIGKDASNDYSINIWDADGKLMFSQGGITDAAIKDAIIRDDMVSDTANIKASKLDISSLFSEINGSTETINSNKVLIDADSGTLDVAFTQMTSDVNDISETVTTQGTALSVVQGQINSKIWMEDIKEVDLSEVEGSITTLETQYSELNQTVNGISATVGQHTTQIANKADSSAVTTVNDRVTEVEADLDGFRTSVSETYATKTALSATDAKAVNAAAAASNAQSTADSAATAAGNAQKAADDAQDAADKVQEDVGLLETRVSTAETSITQNAEQIALRATKTELTTVSAAASNAQSTADDAATAANTAQNGVNALQTRMTTAETNIEQNAEQIALRATKMELTTAVDSIEVGGRNLIENSSFDLSLDRWLVNPADTKIVNIDDFGSHNSFEWSLTNQTSNVWYGLTQTISNEKIKENGQFTLSGWAYIFSDVPIESAISAEVKREYTTTNYHESCGAIALDSGEFPKDEWFYFEKTYTLDITNIDRYYVYFWIGKSGHAKISQLKFEKGNKASDWTPASEDYYTKTQTDAQIKVSADAITSTVTALETTLTEDYSTTSEMNSAITQKAGEITQTVSANYATKTALSQTDTKATNAATAAADAQSAADDAQETADKAVEDLDSLTTRVTNAESSITQNATAISQKVSSSEFATYKTTVTSNIDTAKSEAISTAASDATTKANAAKSEAISTAAADATEKADAAEEAANDYTDGKIQTVTTEVNTVKSTVAQHTTSLNNITSRVSTNEQSITTINGNVSSLTNRMSAAEQKITDEAIINTVSSTYATKTALAATDTKASNAATAASNAQSDIDNLEIGGRNLLRDSTDFYVYSTASGITGEITDEGYMRIVAESGNEHWVSVKLGSSYTQVENELSEGDEFVISFTMRSSDTTIPPDVYIKNGMGYYRLNGSLSSEWSTVYYAGTWSDANDISPHLGFSARVGTYEIKNCKLEKGNKATDWTPAPEDVDADIKNAQSTADNADSVAASNQQRITTLEQTSDSLTARFTTVDSTISGLTSDIKTEVSTRETMIRQSADGIEIGKSDSEFSMKLSNTELGFYDEDEKVAYVSNKKLYITEAEVTNSFQIGNLAWAKHGNNIGLRWVGDN